MADSAFVTEGQVNALLSTIAAGTKGKAQKVGGNVFLGAQSFEGAAPTFAWVETDQPANGRRWAVNLFNGVWRLVSTDDAGGFQAVALSINRTGAVTVLDDAYGAGWDGNSTLPTKNAIYDAIEAVRTLASQSAVAAPSYTQKVTMSGVGSVTELTIPTYESSGVVTHPSVVHAPELWNGYPYWMAFTPYPSEDSEFENPSIVASYDGVTWVVPTGLANPIDPWPGGASYNSDTDLTLGADGIMHCVWRQFAATATGDEERIYVLSSEDGTTWSDKTKLFSNDMTARRIVSPSAIQEPDGTWRIYGVDIIPSPNTVVTLTADTLTGVWSAPTVVTDWGGFPAGREPWHMSAWRDGGEYFLLIDDTATGVSGVAGDLYLSSSRVADAEFTNLGQFPSSTRHYRTCCVPATVNGVSGYQVWFSTINKILHGFVEASAVTRKQSSPETLTTALSGVAPYLFADVVNRPAATGLGSTSTGQTWTIYDGDWRTYVKAIGINANANGKAVVNVEHSDVAFGFTVKTPNGSGAGTWIIARATDTNNYWRFGLDSDNSLKLQSIEAGAIVQSQTTPGGLFGPGTDLQVVCNGNSIAGYVAGFAALSIVDDFNATATRFGVQNTRPELRASNFYAYSLGTVATTGSSAYATAAQGAKADTATQPATLTAAIAAERANAYGIVVHGATAGTARPSTGYGGYIWHGSVQPTNAVSPDIVIRTDEAV